MNNSRNIDFESLIAKFLDGDLSRVEEEQLHNHLAGSNMKKIEFKDYQEIWEKSNNSSYSGQINADHDWEKVKKRMGFEPTRQKIPLKTYLLRVSAIAVLAVGLTILLAKIVGLGDSIPADYMSVAAISENQVVELPDGSVVKLKKGSEIYRNTEFGANNRDLILRGEASFDVHRNEDLPFRIFSGESTIEVLGTSFNVKCDSNLVVVGVFSGKVAFYETAHKENRVELIKNEQASFLEADNVFKRDEELDIDQMAWRKGQFYFKNAELYEVLSEIALLYNKELIVQEEALEGIPKFNIDIKDEPLEVLADAISATYASNYLAVSLEEEKIIVKRKD